MKLDETVEMAYPRKYLEHIVIGLEDALNKHLVKLFAFDFPAEARGNSGARCALGSIRSSGCA
jgi:hypothetical protein